MRHWVERGNDRLRLHWYEDRDANAPMVVLWPAMGVPAGYYRPFATALGRAGLAVVVVDLRGTGASTPRATRVSRYGYAELTDDVGAVLDAVKPYRDGRRLVLLGHSLGGQTCLLHLARGGVDGEVDALALVAVGMPHWRVYRGARRGGVLALTQGIGAAAALLRVWPGWGFGGRQSRGVIRDWAYTARTGRFPHQHGVDMEAALAGVRTPVLAVSLEHDQYIPAATVDHLVAKLAAARVQRAHYDGKADHFNWARLPDGPLTDRITDFVRTPPA
jgi:predicted alpha/beta hydrolase